MQSTLITIIMGIGGSLIGVLLGIIAYLLKNWISESKEWKTLVTTKVDELSAKLSVVIVNYNNQNTTCKDRHGIISKAIDMHTNQLERHEVEIAILKNERHN